MRGEMFVDFEALVAIVDQGSFVAAARHLRVSPSALTQRVRNLEESVGVRLLNRTTRSVSPTSAGSRLIARVAPALAELKGALKDTAEIGEAPARKLRIAVPRLISSRLIQPILLSFLETYPAVSLEVIAADAVMPAASNEFDASIRLGHRIGKGISRLRLTPDLKMSLVASPAYLEKFGYPERPQDLRHHKCLGYRSPSDGSLYHWRFLNAGHRIDVVPEGPLMTTEPSLLIGSALKGLGIAYLPEEAILQYVSDKVLIGLLPEWSVPISGFHLYFPHVEKAPSALEALVRHFQQSVERDEERAFTLIAAGHAG